MAQINHNFSSVLFKLASAVAGFAFPLLLVWLWFGVSNAQDGRGQLVSSNVELELELFAPGFEEPVHVVSSGVPGDGRLFVVEQVGTIRIINANGSVRAAPFLDISDRIFHAGRTGLFGLAFHPDYADNGLFYVHYIHKEGVAFYSRLSRFSVSDDPNVADGESENILLTVAKSQGGHNAGDIHFGPDGYLYYPLGDGDSSMITDRPQEPTTLLGKLSRINVDNDPAEKPADCPGQGSGDYSIPLSNPANGAEGGCGEIWASGLRNPWRFSFDLLTGDLYLSDVGEAAWDEINYLAAGMSGGQNYGWPCYEAMDEFEPERCEAGTVLTFPILSLAIGEQGDCSVVGGYVYRGAQFPELYGRYILADFCSGNFRDLARNGTDWIVTDHGVLSGPGVVSFGEDNNGELYVVNRTNGNIYRLTGEEGPFPPTHTPTHTPSATETVMPGTATVTTTPDMTLTPTVTLTPNVTPAPLDYQVYTPVILFELFQVDLLSRQPDEQTPLPP